MTITVRSNGARVAMQEHKANGCVVSSIVYLDDRPAELPVPEGGRLELWALRKRDMCRVVPMASGKGSKE